MADLKELKKLVAFMRKAGVTEYKSGDTELKLSPEAPVKRTYNKKDVTSQVDDIPNEGPTEEELLFWSAGGPSQSTEGN